MFMNKIGSDFLDKAKYNETFKKPEIEHVGKGIMNKEDPRL